MLSIPRWFPRPSVVALLIGLLSFSTSLEAQINGSVSGSVPELVMNGGFEDGVVQVLPVNGTAVGGGSTSLKNGSLASWDVGPSTNMPNVLATNESLYFATIANGDPAGGGPHSGEVAAVFPNFPTYDGYVSQAIAGVVAGGAYRISFWLSNQIGTNPNNYMDVNWGGSIASLGAPITGGMSLSGGSPSIPGAIPIGTAWTYYQFDVVATSNNARLSFIGGNSAAANLIDDVSVVAIPEPSTLIMLGAGMFLMGLRRHRRARVA
jgi:hypothetical protein